MKVLITGGAGFIGSNFTYYMLKNHPEENIVCLDLLTYAGNLSSLKNAMNHTNFRFVRGDIADFECVNRLFEAEKFDVVVNFAAESHVDRSIDNSHVFVTTNILGTHNLLEASRKHGIGRFHQVSTDEVYGDLPLDGSDLLFAETTPLCASSPYSASKASADLMALAYYRTYNLPVTITRCSNNYGPYHFPEKLIPLMIIRAVQNQSLPVYGTGKNVRDWLYVEDHCSAIDAVIKKGIPGQVYNVGGYNERSNLKVVQAILDILGKSHDLIQFVADRPGHDLRYAINSEKIRSELGWMPQTTFEAGLAKTVNWYLSHREWWEDILSGEYDDFYKKNYGNR